METTDVLIIIPAYNEEKNIGQVLRDIRQLHLNVDIIVINDSSKDNTEHVVRQNGEKIINHPFNMGYGGALQTGFKYAVDHGYEYVIQFDGDGQHDPSNLQKIIETLKTGNYDIVIGSRFLVKNYFQMNLLKRIAITMFSYIIRIFTGQIITDPTSGLQGLNYKSFNYYSLMGNFPDDFPDADTLIHVLKRNFRVIEVPVVMRNRLHGQSMHSGLKSLYYIMKMSISISVVLLRSSFNNGNIKG